MELQITELILKHGLPIVIMALIVMCLVGFVKIFTKGIVNKKQYSEKAQKWLSKLYLALALVFSFAVVICYRWLLLKVSPWTLGMVKDAGIVWTVTSPLYQLYKQFGGRKLLVAVVSGLQKLFKGKNKDTDEILAIVMSVLSQDAPLLTEDRKVKIETDLKEKLGGSKSTTSSEVK